MLWKRPTSIRRTVLETTEADARLRTEDHRSSMGPTSTGAESPVPGDNACRLAAVSSMVKNTSIVAPAQIEGAILLLRGEKVILDGVLARLYGVETRALVQAVKRNLGRFPEDFMFQLTRQEWESLRSQVVISGSGGRRYPPYAFTEQGVAMLSSVLRSERAVQVNIEIMRAFVRLRQILASNETLARKLAELEQKYDAKFRVVFDPIRQLMAPPEKKKAQIGFSVQDSKKKKQ
jgi:hypothetical protein